ncbi:MAG TPA: Ppx/GppA phosphatase family protein [Terriglobales bacterium]|nr:Ppx/GppA phosphatase family protein [Terriglobales bacterium]
MAVFAAIDIGSNSVRMKIARLVRHRLVLVQEDREVTRLGKSVFKTGLLSPSSMAHTVEVLRRFHKAVQKHGAHSVRVVGTSALRDARNAQSFLDWVYSVTGWKVETVSGLEEARLIHLGLLANSRFGNTPLLLADLGGGSCELTISVGGHIRYTASLPLGAVRLTEEFLKHDPPKRDELHRMTVYIDKELARARKRIIAFRPRKMIATSGTAAALAAVCTGKNSRVVAVPRSGAAKVTRKLSRMKISQRTSLDGVGPRRAEIIVAGAQVFVRVLEQCRLGSFRYSPLGLRDGLLAQMAADYDRRTRSHRQIESDRWDSLIHLGKSYHVDWKYSKQVRTLAVELFRQLRAVHQLPPAYEEWISAAALLHEAGIYLNRYGWHRHTHYIIAHSEAFGYTQYERLLIAAIARYLGNSRPTPGDKPMKVLLSQDRAAVLKAVLLLRLARALNQGRSGAVKSFRTQVKGATVRLLLRVPRRRADLEVWSLEKEASYFRELFGRELEAALS